jgi:ABC-type transport system involved in cytochrome bd biosynthesis fused ATPase/permease subunit
VLLLAFAIPILSSIFEPSRKRSNNQRVEEAAIYEEMELLLSSLRESILFHYYNALFSEITKAQKRLQKILNRKYFYQSANEIRISVLFGISLFLTLRYGVTAVRNDQMPGVDFAVMALIPLAIFDPISAIPASLVFKNRAQESEAEINKVLESSDKQEDIIDEFSQSPITSMGAIQSLELKSISALLGEHEFPPVSVRLTPGEIGIISGKSGCGKSSLLNTLIGQLPHNGEYLINNSTDVEKYFPYFSVLLQDDHLFTTSLRENLLIANPALSDEEIWELLELVELRERFETDPQGLDTFIGASIGMTTMPISAGEAQRLRFIRALARPADLYLWDEPFEYLDRELIARLLPKSIAYLKRKSNPIIMAISHIPLEINNVDLTTTYISLAQSGVDK